MRGEVASDRTRDEEESRVEFAFSSLPFGLSGNGRGGRAVRTSAASSGTKSCFDKSAGHAPRLLGSVWA